MWNYYRDYWPVDLNVVLNLRVSRNHGPKLKMHQDEKRTAILEWMFKKIVSSWETGLSGFTTGIFTGEFDTLVGLVVSMSDY